MTKRPKTIRLYLMDGEANGRIKCTMANWTGIAYKIPRTRLNDCSDREHLSYSGVYFLFGTSGDDENSVYIGQGGARKNGDAVLKRISEPHNNIDWTEAIVFTTTGNTFGQTEISYLENRFHELAKEANRYNIVNATTPTQGNTTEEIVSELEEYIEYAQVFIATLGHPVFAPILEVDESDHSSEFLYLRNSKVDTLERNYDAVGRRTSDGFVVLKGSKLASTPTNSCPSYIKSLREKFASRIDSNYVLTEDTLLGSPSTAAGFVVYASQNGLLVWITKDGIQLKNLDNRI